MKDYNVLILDDIKLTRENICKRIFKVNAYYSLLSGINIIPHSIEVDINNLAKAATTIANYIDTKKIDFLLLDRGFSSILEEDINGLDCKILYAENKKGVLIEEILQLIPQKIYKQINGIIIYTYNPQENTEYIEPESIKQNYLDILPKTFDKQNIQIFMSNSEIYKLAGLKLYTDILHENYLELGLKADFQLYGLFMGEILYHRVISMINHRKKTNLIAKKKLVFNNIIILFFVFTGLSIGGNALYNMLVKHTDNYFLLVISVIFSILMPLFVLKIKPELVISIDKENT